MHWLAPALQAACGEAEKTLRVMRGQKRVEDARRRLAIV